MRAFRYIPALGISLNTFPAPFRPSKFPEIESELAKWLYECRDKKVQLTDSVIRNKAKEVAKQLQIPEDKFKASSGWVENFKHRHGIRRGQFHGNGRNARLGRLHGVGVGDSTPHFGGLSSSIADYLVQNDLYTVEDTLRRSATPRPGNVSAVDSGGSSQGASGGTGTGSSTTTTRTADCSLPSPVRVESPTRGVPLASHPPSGIQTAGSDGAPSSVLTSLSSASSDHPPADLAGRYNPGVPDHVASTNQEYPLPLPRQRQQRMHVFDCYTEGFPPPTPTAADALDAVEKVMHFMDSQYKEEDALSEFQRRTLLHIHMKITELKQPLSSAEDAARHEL